MESDDLDISADWFMLSQSVVRTKKYIASNLSSNNIVGVIHFDVFAIFAIKYQ